MRSGFYLYNLDKNKNMGKEKEMLKEILANTQSIMKHFKIESVEKRASSVIEGKKEIKKVLKKISAKKSKSKK